MDESDSNYEMMRTIEFITFKVVKKEMGLDDGWMADLDINKKADKMIASVFVNSFRSYEKNKDSNDVSYFNFKKK